MVLRSQRAQRHFVKPKNGGRTCCTGSLGRMASPMATEKLLFIDTNIWLDFYRSRGADLSLKLLDHVKSIASRLIVTYQIEMEFKKNRQSAILEGISEL